MLENIFAIGMLVLLILGIIMAIVDNFGQRPFEITAAVFTTSAVLLIMFFVGNFIISTFLWNMRPTEDKLQYSISIYALNDGAYVCKGISNISEGVAYAYMRYDSEKQAYYSEVIHKNVYVHESNDGDPRLEVHSESYVDPTLTKWFIDFAPCKTYIFVVPYGSVSTQYRVDL